ncbi:MAG TPA: ferritin-like domain-containing protein [Dehalococcoidia bacterium]|nr:ferritin-like domain-containing protein [Dehalococcoidia bacterium]
MAVDVDTLQMLRTEPEVPHADLSWLNLDTAWGMTAKPGKRGLTLDEINVGAYGDVPDQTTNYSFRPRGAAARREAPRSGMPYVDRADVWSQNAALLYEEAVARQWSSATDIPWEQLEPLPDDLEQAFCQFCTFLTEVEFIAGDTPGQWLPFISNDYYESKLFLASQIVDEARHLDVFRKRALANGGGLLQQGFGGGLRNIIDAKDFTEMSALMHIVGEGFVQSIFRMGEYIAQNEVEKRIFRLCGQDESRHLAFGVLHLKYVLETQPWRREEIHSYLDKAEGGQLDEGIATSRATSECLAILMGGGKDNIDEGIKKLMVARKRQINEYMHRLEVAGLADRKDRMNPAFGAFLDVN